MRPHPPTAVTPSDEIASIADSTFQLGSRIILDPAKIARISHDRHPVTWNKGIDNKTTFCGSVSLGKGGIGLPARRALLAGADRQIRRGWRLTH